MTQYTPRHPSYQANARFRIMSELKGKRALVTGASSGIGAAIAQELARRGVHLVLAARRRRQLDEVASLCATFDVTTEVVVADLGKHDEAAQLWRTAARDRVDILVNNAGFGYFRNFVEIDWTRDAEL